MVTDKRPDNFPHSWTDPARGPRQFHPHRLDILWQFRQNTLSCDSMLRWFEESMLLCVLLTLTAGAAEPNAIALRLARHGQGRSRRVSHRLWADAKATFLNSDNLAASRLGGVGQRRDERRRRHDDVADYFDRHSTFGGFDEDALFVIGSPVTHFAGTPHLVRPERRDPGRPEPAAGRDDALGADDHRRRHGRTQGDPHNDQPDGQVWAWPSGHTSSSVAVASVLHEFYGLKVGLPAYAVAGVVAWRMMDDGDHWASDVRLRRHAWLGRRPYRRPPSRQPRDSPASRSKPYSGNTYAPAVGISLSKRF